MTLRNSDKLVKILSLLIAIIINPKGTAISGAQETGGGGGYCDPLSDLHMAPILFRVKYN